MSSSTPLRRDFLKLAGLTGGGLSLAALAGGVRAADTPAGSDALLRRHWINALDHGVEPGGKIKNTVAINRVIAAIGKAGGGTVYFPPGLYLTGAIHLVSNLTILIDAGATLRFSEDFDEYLPMVPSRWQGVNTNNFSPLIYGVGLENVTLTGRGTIDGAGAVWWDYIIKLRAKARSSDTVPTSKWQDAHRAANGGETGQSYGFLRPSLLQLIACTNVRVEQLTLRNSPFWTTHYVDCDGVVVDGITVLTPDSPNTDGINPESSRNVMISNCRLDTDDDCITIKSGKRRGKQGDFLPCENITVTNCVMTGGAAGVGIGSEMSGGVRRVTVSNCVIDGSGIHIKTVRGRGGVVEDLEFSNLVLNNIQAHAALHLNMLYWEKTSPLPVTETTPQFRNIRFNNIRANGTKEAALIEGLEEMPVENVSFNHVDLAGSTGFTIRDARGVRLNDVRVAAESGAALMCENVNHLDVTGFAPLGASANATPAIQLHNVGESSIDRCGYTGGPTPFVEITGDRSQWLRLRDADLVSSADVVRVAKDVPTDAVKLPR